MEDRIVYDNTLEMIARKQSELVYGNTFVSQISTCTVGVLFAGILYLWTNRIDAWIWFSFLVATVLIRLALFRAYQKHAPSEQNFRKWLRYYAIAVMVSGVVWAGGTVYFFQPDDQLVCFFITMVVAGVVAGSLPALAPHFPSFCIFAVPILLFFSLRSLLVGKTEFYALGVLTLLFAGVFLTSARYFSRILMGALLLNIENESLVEHLKEERNLAEATSHAKSAFLANMSHEIRTPMNGIIGMTEICLGTDITAEQQKYLNAVKVSADNLLTIINNILDFSKIEVGRIKLDHVPFLLRAAVGQALQTIALQAAGKGLTVLFSPASNVPDALVGDPGRLQQVLDNLVDNALKFGGRGEVLVTIGLVGTDERGCTLSFGVQDEGIGIPAEQMRRIFDPFEQADQSSTKSFSGTGLGLTISKSLVELMGGAIQVESEAGKGSLFTFTARFDIQDRSQQAPALLPLEGRHALVVNNTAINRAVLTDYLDAWGITVDTADNVAEALQMLDESIRRATPYHFVLIDLLIPAEGWQLVADIRHRPAHDDAYLVLTRNAGRRSSHQRNREPRVDGYLIQPIIPTELHDLLCLLVTSGSPARHAGDGLENSDPLSGTKQSLSILVAEDIPINQLLIKTILARYGHSVSLVSNGEEAVRAWEKDADGYDLIFMDVQMDVLDGIQATRRIRAAEAAQGGHIPIVAMTAYAMDEDRGKCCEAGMDDFISKPFHRKDILATLNRLAGIDGIAAQFSFPLTGAAGSIPGGNLPASGDEIFNRLELSKRLGQESLIAGFVFMFIETVDQELPALEKAIIAADFEAATSTSHSLKGVTSNIGADRMHSIIRELHGSAKDKDIQALRGKIAPLRAEYDLFKAIVDPILREANVCHR